MFDPYHQWLGIAKDQRPITYFQLLGISAAEKDSQVIQEAAERQAARLSSHRDGPQAKVCARLLQEIKQARVTLLNPAKRNQYEALLRKTSSREVAEEAAKESEKAPPAAARDKNKGSRQPLRGCPARKRDQPEKAARPWFWPVVGGAAGALLLLGGLTVFWLTRPNKVEAPPRVDPVARNAPPQPPSIPLAPPDKKDPLPPPLPEKKDPPPPPVVDVPKPPEVKPVPKVVVKCPVPDQAAQDRAEKELKETYEADYARQKPEDQLALAAKLLQPGRENRADPAAWFVLLREARDLAIRAERPRLAVEAINEIDKWFLIDPFEMKLKALATIAKSPKDLATRSVTKTALSQVEEALAGDKYDTALQLVDVAEAAARTSKQPDAKQLDPLKTRKAEVQGFQKDYQAVLAARAKLKEMPDDPDANLVVGKHLCFFQGQWDQGLPLLAKGSTAELKQLAQKDLAQPADVKAQLAVGDGWWDEGKRQEGRAATHLRQRALFWYEQAEPKAVGEDKGRIAERSREGRGKVSPRLQRLRPGSYFGRGVEEKILLLREGGGTMQSEEAVERGLDWLSKHQAPAGNWSTDAFHLVANCNCSLPGQTFDVAGTAFGLLPFLAAGETHQQGRYARTVQRGLAYLLVKQKPEGNFSDNMYENALATTAVCEAYGLTRDRRLAVPAQAAVNFIVKAQNGEGGWGYGPGQKGDTSVTGWQFSALKAGHYAKLTVPLVRFAYVGLFLDKVADPGGLGYGYNTPGSGRSTSATGLLCREYLGWGPRHSGLAKGVEQLLLPQNFVTKDKPSIYFLYYGTQVMHHVGGKSWETWNPRVRDLLIELQDKGKELQFDHQMGSWSPKGDEWASQGGRLMFTSLALLTLEVYYCHIPLNGYGPAVLQD